jgi:hypothetical protein
MVIFKQRDAMAVSAVLEGLQFMLQDARAGDDNAKQTLKALVAIIDEARDLASPLTVIRQ